MYNLDTDSPLTTFPAGVEMRTVSLLAEKIFEKKCVLFAGTGISLASGLVTWKELISRLKGFARDKEVPREDIDYIQSFIDREDYITAAELIQRSLRQDSITQKTKEIMLTARASEAAPYIAPEAPPEPNEIHYLLTRTGFNHLVTTNYDELLDTAVKDPSSKRYTRITRGQEKHFQEQIGRDGGCLIKIHGSVDNSDDSIVLTRSGYLKAYSGGFINNWLRSSLISNSFLFIGYSLNDYDILSLIKEARASVDPGIKIGPHFAILDAGSVREIYAKYLEDCYNINAIRIDIHKNRHNVRDLLVGLHGRIARIMAANANFTLLPNTCFASAMIMLCRKIKEAAGADALSLYMVKEVDSRVLCEWPLAPTDRPTLAPEAVNEFFLQMRDIHYCYLCDRTRDAMGARSIFPAHGGRESLIAMPVVSHGKKWGLLVLSSRIPRSLTEDHLNALVLFTKAIADTYVECTNKIKAVTHIANNLTFGFIRKFLDTSRIIKNASKTEELDYILYTIDYMRGELIAHCDEQKFAAALQQGMSKLRFDQKYLAVKALNRGTALRYTTPDAAIRDNPECEEEIRHGFGLFNVRGNIYINPIRSFGHISAILVAWNQKECKDGVFHSTIFDRVKRSVRVFMNDPTRNQQNHPENAGAQAFITALDRAMARWDHGERWGKERISDPTFQRHIINAILETLTHESTRLMKVRLWVPDPGGIGSGFTIHSSFTHKKATFAGLSPVNGYVDKGIRSIASDQYTNHTKLRFRSDPYAQFQKPDDFNSPDGNSAELHKDPRGKWITAPIVWRRKESSIDSYRSGESAELLGFLSADSHLRNDKTGEPEEIRFNNPLEQESYQRCVVDLATHLLAPVLHAIVTSTPQPPSTPRN